jgi:hypothetical protein
MEISDVRRRVHESIERARRKAAERRGRVDAAGRDYEQFLEHVAVPVFRQVSSVLRADGYFFTVFTPVGSVRLMSDKSSDDYIELSLDTSEGEPRVMGHTNRARGRRVLDVERPVSEKPIAEITDEDVVAFVAQELEPFVER